MSAASLSSCAVHAVCSASCSQPLAPLWALADPFSNVSNNINPCENNVHTTVKGPNNGKISTTGSSIECSAEAWAGSLTFSADAYASAGASPHTDNLPPSMFWVRLCWVRQGRSSDTSCFSVGPCPGACRLGMSRPVPPRPRRCSRPPAPWPCESPVRVPGCCLKNSYRALC